MKQIIVTNIDWDTTADVSLPPEIAIEISKHTEHLLEDIDGYSENLTEYLSDMYGYCIKGYSVEVKNTREVTIVEETKEIIPENPESKNSKYASIGKMPLEGKDKIYIAGWLTDDENEDGEIIAAIIISSKEVIYFDEDAPTDEYAQMVINETIRSLLPDNIIRVKTPVGYLMVETKGEENDYPGVYVSFSEDGKAPDLNNLIACVEYDTVDNEIKTETYCAEHDNPVAITHYESGEVI